MNTIKLNEYTFELDTFNKSSNYTNDTVISNAFCQIRTTDMNVIRDLASEPISIMQIYHDDTLIYSLDNANGKVISVDELLTQTTVAIKINITFVPTSND